MAISNSLQHDSLAFDAHERLVGFSTDKTLVTEKEGIKGVVNLVLNVGSLV